MFIRLLLLATALVWAPQVHAKSKRSNKPTAQELYDRCLKSMQRGYYTKALDLCNKVRNYHRDDPLSVLAELAVADSYFKRGEYEQARLAYEDFGRLHPKHRSLDYVTWRIGQCHFKQAPSVVGRDQSRTVQAVAVWRDFERRFPDSKYQPEVAKFNARATNKLASKELFIATHYRIKKSYPAVIGRAKTVLQRYPTSRHVPRALIAIAKGYHRNGQVAQAQLARERLETDYPKTNARPLKRALARPPGVATPEPTFVKPYTYSGMNSAPPPSR